MKNVKGKGKDILLLNGCCGHGKTERAEYDYYSTDPKSVELLLDKLKEDNVKLSHRIWECACGCGNISKVMERHGYDVTSTDLIDRGFGRGGENFLTSQEMFDGDIMTNPPYAFATEFARHSMELISNGRHVIMLLKIQFLESNKRYELFKEYPPRYVYVFVERQKCLANNDAIFLNNKQSAFCYAWFIWEKGYNGEPILRWIKKKDNQMKLF